MTSKITLVLGGASSGKSNIAEQLCFFSDLPRSYIATAQSFDAEMATKIAQHKSDRGDEWTTFEEPFAVDEVLKTIPSGQIVLLDCATLWLTNHLLAEANINLETEKLLQALSNCKSQVILVSNEVGMGIVPENALARKFRIAQGQLNRKLAKQADTVIGVMAGLPFALKGSLPAALTETSTS
ncbi:adenosylcobinamide kinase /adenosylcobinamide-phosphate guanylyltransferase [Pacificibacter maritimus]|uniref:Bifunctional adenosylcobalamin biosynthesis protein n=1 Tax=Pacificibacter maritimus TaxID=762213 RepID=A0A3N4UFM7_9RHOB|nr:bifunctional adenosylcobinamide kinase/adenosylcobinamide-phosphate guanylyltransferase [Pacificibacter maritimus]RPE67265.1 adenosylcobinamide kinase /adenosylcobinamide-phosphate guanylyltransferase [Pacificibacter maritimus]